MKKLFSVPNLLSLGNLLCGCIATLNIIEADFYPAAICVGLACVFDFLDGFAARGLKQGSPMGKELDSLADMVTFGVVPGMVMFQLIRFGLVQHPEDYSPWMHEYLPYAGFLIPLFSGLRLAKFNVDTRQSESFIGLPTLANAIFIVGIPLALGLSQGQFSGMQRTATPFDENDPENAISMLSYLNREQFSSPDSLFPRIYGPGTQATTRSAVVTPAPETMSFWDCGEYLRDPGMQENLQRDLRNLLLRPWLLLVITLVFADLLLLPIPMFSFKIKSVKWKGNEVRYIFLGLVIGLAVWLKLTAIPLVIVLYILMSLLNNALRKVK